MSFPGLESLKTIYQSILAGHVSQGFSSQIQRNAERLVNTALELHQKVTSSFLPTAIKFHYIFNLRDLSNIFQVRSLRFNNRALRVASSAEICMRMATLYCSLWQIFSSMYADQYLTHVCSLIPKSILASF